MTRVLVLDDDVTIAELMHVILEEAGADVIVRYDAADLPAGPFDRIVTDLIGLSAYSRTEARDWILRLADRYPGVPVIVATAHKAAVADSTYLGAQVLSKPFDVDQLIAVVTS